MTSLGMHSLTSNNVKNSHANVQPYGTDINATVPYVFTVPDIFPTYSIEGGSVFQANATTTSTFTGGETGTYNTTYVYMTYNIPIEPSTNYVTMVFNGSWILSNIYPSTFLPLLPHPDFVTIEDVKGFSSVQVTLIEPSQDIGETTYQTLEYEMPSGIQPPVDYFTNIISYPIELSGVPSGTGYYQQLITIKNPSKYGINTAGSNIQFSASDGTLLYAWEQSINSSALQVWIKNYYGNSIGYESVAFTD